MVADDDNFVFVPEMGMTSHGWCCDCVDASLLLLVLICVCLSCVRAWC